MKQKVQSRGAMKTVLAYVIQESKNIGSSEEYRQAAGADVTTGWEDSRQRLYEMRGTDRFPEQQIEMADRESVPVYDAGRGIASNILRLAKNVSKIGSYEDDLDNIIALSALVGLSVAGIYKLVEVLQSQNTPEIPDEFVEEIIEELSQDYGLEQELKPEIKPNLTPQIEPEQEHTLTF